MSEEQKPSPPSSKKEKVSLEVQERALSNHVSQSYWPFGLAFALIVFFMGVITHPVVMVIGILLVAGAIIGWGFERR